MEKTVRSRNEMFLDEKKDIIQWLKGKITDKDNDFSVNLADDEKQRACVIIGDGFSSIVGADFQNMDSIRNSLIDSIANLDWESFENGGAEDYLVNYFSVLRNLVFSKDNDYITETDFKKSKFIKALTSFFVSKDSENENGYQISLYDPFISDVIVKALKYCKILSVSNELSRLRVEMFLDNVRSAFSHYCYFNERKHLVEISEDNRSFYVMPTDRLSSICYIEPIRLFDPIAAYIRSLVGTKKKNLKICISIIGRADKKGLHELGSAIISWYCLLPEKIQKQRKLNLKISQYSMSDDYSFAHFDGSETIEKEENKIKISREKTKVFYDISSFDTSRLASVRDNSDMVFVLDCPWLFDEKSKEVPYIALRSFCIGMAKNNDIKGEKTDYLTSFYDDYKGSVMSSVNEELLAMQENADSIYGRTVRFLKTGMVSALKEVEKSNDKKEIYIYCSDSHAIKHSMIEKHPFSRREHYDGKNYTIIEFSNKKAALLRVNQKTLTCKLVIDMWALLKYLCLPYYYSEFASKIEECIDNKKILDSDLFDICRGIKFTFKVTNIYIVDVSLSLSDYLEEIISRYKEKRYIVNTKIKLCEQVLKLMVPLCRSAFAESSKYGDDAIKTCFETCFYNASKDLNSLLFYHKYRCAVENLHTSNFSIHFDKCIKLNQPFRGSEYLDLDIMSDKKIYSDLLYIVEYSSSKTDVMEAICEVGENYFKDAGFSHYIEQIMYVCEVYGETETRLYSNLRVISGT